MSYDTVQAPLVADLAPGQSRSRYMAVNGFFRQLGFIAGPGLGGLLLGGAGGALWITAVAVCVSAAFIALAPERAIPNGCRLTPSRQPTAPG